MEDERLDERDVERVVDAILAKRVSPWVNPKFISRTPPDPNQVWQWSAQENAFVPATLSGTSSGHTIKENGTAQTSRANLDIIDADAGAGLVTDDGTDTELNLSLYRLEAQDHNHTATGLQAGQLTVAALSDAPAGELGGTWASPTVDATHSGSAHHTRSHDLEGASDHTTSSGVDGHFMRQTGATTYAFEEDDYVVNFIIDGGGSVITNGTKGTLHLPSAGVITQWKIEADQSGTIGVDVKKATPSWTADVATPSYSSIAASAKPTLSSQVEKRDTTLTGWTTTVAQDDQLQFVVDASPTIVSVTRVTVSLLIRKT